MPNSESQLVKPTEALFSDQGFRAKDFFQFDQRDDAAKQETFHGVTIGSLNLLIPENTLGEVVENMSVCPLPKTSNFLVGTCSLRGEIIPVFNLHGLLSMTTDSKPGMVMIVGVGRNKVGFSIEALPVKVVLSENQKTKNVPPLPELIRPFVKTAFSNNQVWVDWDIFGFFKSVGKLV